MSEGELPRRFLRLLESRRIRRFPDGEAAVSEELEAARHDLREAEESLRRGSFKWATVQGYYAIFHAARALLFARGYRERSHSALAQAIKALYVDRGRLPESLHEAHVNAMSLRETADYRSQFSERGAVQVAAGAREYIAAAEAILREDGLLAPPEEGQ